MLKLDGNEFDPKQLFKFDLLEQILIQIGNSCESSKQRIDWLEQQLKERDLKIDELQNQLNYTNNKMFTFQTYLQQLANGEIHPGTILFDNIEDIPRNEEMLQPAFSDNITENQIEGNETDANKFDTINKSDQNIMDNSQIHNTSNLSVTRNKQPPLSSTPHKATITAGSNASNSQSLTPTSINGRRQKGSAHITPQESTKTLNKHAVPEQNIFEDVQVEENKEAELENEKIQEQINAGEISPQLINILFKKVQKAEKSVDLLNMKIKKMNTLNSKINTQEISLQKIGDYVNLIKADIAQIKDDYAKNKEEMEKLMVKCQDFNIYDIFKDGGDGNIDAAKALVMNLEKKVFKKFGFVEERLKTVESQSVKDGNLLPQLQSQLQTIELRIKQIETDSGEIKNLASNDDFQKLNEKISQVETNLSSMLSSQNLFETASNELRKEFDNKLVNAMTEIKDKVDEMQISAAVSSNPEISKDDIKLIQIFTKRVNELDKEIKLKLNMIDLSAVHSRMDTLEQMINERLDKNDLMKLHDKINPIDINQKEMLYQLNFLTEEKDRMYKEINSFKALMENLSGKIAGGGSSSGESNSSNKQTFFDVTKFIEVQKFEDNNKNIFRIFDNIKRDCEDLHRKFEHIRAINTNNVTIESFNIYKNTVDGLFEQYRQENIKKFADRISTDKALRLLELNIKDGGDSRGGADNWMIAKKPMSGYQCASCESYIKDIGKRYEYLPWNKYPIRDDKSYRMGHGFSRMLQLVNMDILKTAESKKEGDVSDSGSDSCDNKRPRSGSSKKRILPKLKKKKRNIITIDRRGATNPNIEEINNASGEENNKEDLSPTNEHGENTPKVVKIYKKIKAVNSSTNTVNIE